MNEPNEDMLRRAAADYNAPPETPREQMWARIRAELNATADPATRESDAATAVPDAATRRRGDAATVPFPMRARRWGPWGIGLAAMLALGIGIGRMLPETGRMQVAEAPAASSGDAKPQEPAQEPVGDVAPEPQLASSDPAPAAADDPASDLTDSPRRRVAASPRPEAASRHPERLAAAEPETGPEAGAQIYRFAAGATLSQAEALLVAYRADVAAGRLHPQIETWARDVLSTTRLLLDSPAAEDPRLRTLLEDLELVLAQLVQLGGDPAAEELDLLDQTLEQRDMLPRLRTTIPAVAIAETE